jgi:hypothetical protein
MSCGCNTDTATCGNPCATSETNTAACESLPSQIENFTAQFFGVVVKSEVDGEVVWTLPCNLETGLENNPRAEDEWLACYFLRLFRDGILGLTGPQGETGADGTNGRNAYTVTLQSFTQPTLGSPTVTVQTQYNPAILENSYIFIATSGWYHVDATDTSGTLFLTLVKEVTGASGTITAGKLVVPSGFPGVSVTGPTGPQGPQGPQGPAGASLTEDNAFFFATVGVDFNLPLLYAAVDYTNSTPQILLPTAGIYKVTAVVGLIGLASVAITDTVSLKLRNTSNASDVSGSEVEVNDFAEDSVKQLVIDVFVTTDGANQTIALFGKCATADRVAARALKTTITAIRIE